MQILVSLIEDGKERVCWKIVELVVTKYQEQDNL